MPSTEEITRTHHLDRFNEGRTVVHSIKDLKLEDVRRLIDSNVHLRLTDGSIPGMALNREHLSVTFINCQFPQSDFSNMQMMIYCNFYYCDLTAANFRGTYICRSSFINCDLSAANFTDTSLSAVSLDQCQPRGMIFKPKMASVVHVRGLDTTGLITNAKFVSNPWPWDPPNNPSFKVVLEA